jgi:pilus assembly protein CpaE
VPDSNSSLIVVAAEAPDSAPIETRRIVAFVADDPSITALRAGLLGLPNEVDVRRGALRQAIRFLEKDAPPLALVVDIEGISDPHVALDDLARVCPPNVKVIVVGDNTDISFYRQLVHELGVTEYLHKPLTRDNVHRLVLPHVSVGAPPHPGARGGHLVAVCGARGGVGTTTVAVNTALALAGHTSGHVALLDLHLQGGNAAVMLGVRPGAGLRIALEDPGRADALFLDRTAIAVTPRLRVIAAEEGFETAPVITDAGLSSMLDLLRQQFNFIVVDLPMPLLPAMHRVIALARQVIVVLAPDVSSLRDTKAIRQLVSRVSGADRVMTVLNRADMNGCLTPALVEKGLGAAPDVVIPELGKRMQQAANLGIPALQRVPALRKHLAPLVREIAGVRAGASRTSLLKRIFRR